MPTTNSGEVAVISKDQSMRIGVLEWICGGGLIPLPIEQVPPSLLQEGWAMLRALVDGLSRTSRATVETSIDSRLVSTTQILNLAQFGCRIAQLDETCGDPISTWIAQFRHVDWLIVIAPEIDGVLENLLGEFASANIQCINCSGDFLANTCDKLRTSQRLAAVGVAHPVTRPIDCVDIDWMASVHGDLRNLWAPKTDMDCTANQPEDFWAVKPRDGAGCEGLLRLTTQELDALLIRIDHPAFDKRQIVQPWLKGVPCSRSAIVDRAGKAHWMPLATQNLALGSQPKYCGGFIPAMLQDSSAADNGSQQLACHVQENFGSIENIRSDDLQLLDDLLSQALDAMGPTPMGWVGVDLLYHPGGSEHPFTVIEINPRFTTSFVGLSQAFRGSLGTQVLAAALGEQVQIPTDWTSVRFEC